jgi:cytochrome b
MQKQRTVYAVWDRTTRVFHWINFICVLALALLGLAILNEKHFGVSSDGKVLLKTLHAYVGYVFALNLGWRLVWAFIGGKYARWKRLLPFGHGYLRDLRSYLRGTVKGGTANYLGHNPLGRLMVSLLLLVLLTQAVTGLILAGTDLYKPPFGGIFADWVTDGDPERLGNLKPGSTDFVVQTSYDEMRNFRKPVVTIHEYTFYSLMVLILLHVLGVIIAEIRERNGLVSAMITGDKALAEVPVDSEENRE